MKLVILYDTTCEADRGIYNELLTVLPRKYSNLELTAGDNKCEVIRDGLRYSDAAILLLSADFFASDKTNATFNFLKENIGVIATIAIMIRHVSIQKDFPFPIYPIPLQPAPKERIELDEWLLAVASQIELSLEVIRLKGQLAAKDAEIALLREKKSK